MPGAARERAGLTLGKTDERESSRAPIAQARELGADQREVPPCPPFASQTARHGNHGNGSTALLPWPHHARGQRKTQRRASSYERTAPALTPPCADLCSDALLTAHRNQKRKRVKPRVITIPWPSPFPFPRQAFLVAVK